MTIQLNSVNKSYGRKPVLFDINLSIPTGSFTVLRGVSGSGKSTLLSIIGGIESVTDGKVIIDGQDVDKLRGKARADFYLHKVGFVFQGFYLQPQLTVLDNISLMGMFVGMSKKEREERVGELTEDLGISGVVDSLPSGISSGQAERACVARAMFMKPEIILADEPTNNLDPENAKNVVEMLKKIQLDMGVTMIVASHDAMMERYATQIIRLENGRVVE